MAQCKFCGNECENEYCEDCQKIILLAVLHDKNMKNFLWKIFKKELKERAIIIRARGHSFNDFLEGLFGKEFAKLIQTSNKEFDRIYQQYSNDPDEENNNFILDVPPSNGEI